MTQIIGKAEQCGEFSHALVQDAAYGTLLREPRRALHARIAEAIESQFTGIAESQPRASLQ